MHPGNYWVSHQRIYRWKIFRVSSLAGDNQVTHRLILEILKGQVQDFT